MADEADAVNSVFGFPNIHSPTVSCSPCPHFPFGHSQPRKFPWKHVTWVCVLPWARPVCTYPGAGVDMVALCTELRSGKLEVWKSHHEGAARALQPGKRQWEMEKEIISEEIVWALHLVMPAFGQFRFWANMSHKFESRQLFAAHPNTWIFHN